MRIQGDTGMTLAAALGVTQGDVVSFVGGGGKTTSMFRLAGELRESGLRVVTTTSTHINEFETRLAPAYITPEEMASLRECLDRHGHCLLAGRPDGRGRVCTLPTGVIAGLLRRPDVDCILVEADGSKSRPLKAPAAHEPVVLGITTILVPVAGMNCIGRLLDEECVHRPEIVARLAGLRPGSPITPEAVARVLAHPEGGAKGLPPGARLVPLVNKVDAGDIRSARETARRLLRRPNVDSVVLGSMDRHRPVREAWVPTAAVIPAGYGEVLPAVQAASGAGLDPVVVVAAPGAAGLPEPSAEPSLRIVRNPEPDAGWGASVRAGINTLPPRIRAALLFPPRWSWIDAGTVESFLQAHRRTLAPLCVSRPGGPILVDRSLFAEIRALGGEKDLHVLIGRHRGRAAAVPDARGIAGPSGA